MSRDVGAPWGRLEISHHEQNVTSPELHLIDLDQPVRGHRRFVSAWVARDDPVTTLVDPGPASSVPHLLERMRAIGVDAIDFIVLTHIHIDHAGGTADVLEVFPGAKVICHEPAAVHLIDPTRLWQGSQKVLGDLADVYGEIAPVPPSAIGSPADVATFGIEMIPTPGHASHHVSFLHGGTLFAGEALGTCQRAGDRLYLRPATPPRFFLEVARESVDRLITRGDEIDRIAFAHHGLVEGRTLELMEAARDQLGLWVAELYDLLAGDGRQSPEELTGRFVDRLASRDPWFAPHADLDADIRDRERTFIMNSVQGMAGYIRESSGARTDIAPRSSRGH